MRRCCLFDLDGTLLNTLPSITYFMDRTLVSFGIPAVGREVCRRCVGDGARALVERVFSHLGLPVSEDGLFPRVLSTYKSAYDAAPLYLTEPYDGVSEMLLRLREEGVGIGVVSNKPHSATLPLVRHFFGDLVSEVQGAEESLPLKPDPAVPLSVMRRLDGTAERTAYVGDSEVDIATGRAMGAAAVIGVLWGFRSPEALAGADLSVGNCEEILRAVRRLPL